MHLNSTYETSNEYNLNDFNDIDGSYVSYAESIDTDFDGDTKEIIHQCLSLYENEQPISINNF